ncbi:maleylpyruvate isomerase family mycothiol-dependent enzyme [Streptomyces sp. NBC_01591]|uniref:maleylpyruvate isomerase family mycothiol-dependent enzyme n=1 Tax=Streptomyces sp. NBC_01591 TaxID=2975888 RepID=UPI002DD8A96C|nr:maleylpyruvate isomerase family mycothiol-dependent enzyme [Streptomyces sp. NBC_01591]WSD66849.1 maleylpyruvate isomerase family mycothiol-dependent enzyme [Streptomyces sp. NBC_01591]
MEITDHIKSLAVEGQLLAAAAQEAGTGARVPTCPDWRVRDLLRHTGMVHRWATAFVVDGHTSYHPDGGEPDLDGPELLDWFREGHGLLMDALGTAPAGLECWTFLPAPSPLAFWARRQAHETTIHRVDAESARGGRPSPVPAAHAVDGIDELLRGFHARRTSRVRTSAPRSLRVRATDADAVWTVRLSPEPPQAVRTDAALEEGAVDCELSASAAELYLTLWNRLPLTAITVTGDPEPARTWCEKSGVTWS